MTGKTGMFSLMNSIRQESFSECHVSHCDLVIATKIFHFFRRRLKRTNFYEKWTFLHWKRRRMANSPIGFALCAEISVFVRDQERVEI